MKCIEDLFCSIWRLMVDSACVSFLNSNRIPMSSSLGRGCLGGDVVAIWEDGFGVGGGSDSVGDGFLAVL